MRQSVIRKLQVVKYLFLNKSKLKYQIFNSFDQNKPQISMRKRTKILFTSDLLKYILIYNR